MTPHNIRSIIALMGMLDNNSLQYDRLEQFAILADARIVLSRDGQHFVMKSLAEAALESAALSRLGYVVSGVIATCPDGIIRRIDERGCGQIMTDAMAVFLDKHEARQPVPPLAWLENLALLEDPRD